MKTFYSKNINNDEIVLDGDEHNHLKNVMRLKVGDTVKVVCGDEYDYFCKIAQINKSNTLLKIDKKVINTANPKFNLTCFMALIKNDHLSLAVQKLTELGCTHLVPFESEFTVNKDKGTKVEKLKIVSEQSIKQCGRSKPISIYPTVSFDKMIGLLNSYDLVIFANESEKSMTLSDVLNKNNNAKNVAIVVGCEGGFSDTEKEKLIESGAKSVTLGSRILRAETAAIMLASIVLYHFKEYN